MLLVHEIGCSIAAPLAGPLGRRSGIPCVVHQNRTGCTFQTPGELHDEAPKIYTISPGIHRKVKKKHKKTLHLRVENDCVPTSILNFDGFQLQELRSSDLQHPPAVFTPHDPSGNPMIATSREKWQPHVRISTCNASQSQSIIRTGDRNSMRPTCRQNAWLGGSSSFLIASRIKSNRVFSGLIIDKINQHSSLFQDDHSAGPTPNQLKFWSHWLHGKWQRWKITAAILVAIAALR